MSIEAMEVVLDHVHARRRRDIDAVAATLDPDVIHEGVLPEMLCRNRGEVLAMIGRRLEAMRSGIDRLEIIDAGSDQAVLGVAGPLFREVESPSLDGEVYVLMTVRGGRITRMRDFRTRADALSAAREAAPRV
jgi:ketosteroid isomerase-like protein